MANELSVEEKMVILVNRAFSLGCEVVTQKVTDELISLQTEARSLMREGMLEIIGEDESEWYTNMIPMTPMVTPNFAAIQRNRLRQQLRDTIKEKFGG